MLTKSSVNLIEADSKITYTTRQRLSERKIADFAAEQQKARKISP
jgi:hypothetical protein